MSWVAVGVGGASLIGGMMSSGAASDAAEGQQAATRESNALQRYMYDNNVALQAPNINTGNAARDRLSYLLGLSPTGFSGGAGSTGQPLTYDQLRTQLLGQFTRNVNQTTGQPQYANAEEAVKALGPAGAYQWAQTQQSRPGPLASNGQPFRPGEGPGYWETVSGPGGLNNDVQRWVPGGSQASSSIDETGLDAEIKRRLAEQDAQRQAALDAAHNDPAYGRLAQQYVPDKFSYTGEDLYKDPSYQFRLDQGQKALDRQGAAAGRFLSGRQLQASSNYNQGAASQEFQNAYSRALGTFSTNEGNRFGAFQANFNNSVNPLLALSGAATLGSQNLGAAGASMAANVGNNLTNQANATGAAGIASANQIGNGLNGAVNGYQQNQLMNSLLNRGSVNNNPGGRTDTLFGNGGFYSGNGGSGD